MRRQGAFPQARRARYVYRFGGGVSDGEAGNRNLLGGKGANLAEMASIGLPVPPGFTLSTEMCARYYAEGEGFPDSLRGEVAAGLAHVEAITGKRFGDAADPLLVSVRSGARVSMPGMMDTVLNLGLNDETVEGLAAVSGDPRFAWDSYRRFIQMYSDVVLGLPHHVFEEALEIAKEDKGVHLDTELEADDWRRLAGRYKALVEEHWGRPFPQEVDGQLWGAIGAVFGSWQSDRAKTYRRLNGIPGDWGTAVNVQAMVFGNMGETSATGVAFTRNPSTGERAYYGEYLINAQGEDVVAGIRTPQDITEDARKESGSDKPSMETAMPDAFAELTRIYTMLEKHYRDMQDMEFTVEDGKLYMLQTRTGKRTPAAAFQMAVDMANEKLITKEEAIMRIKPEDIERLFYPVIDTKLDKKSLESRILGTGINAVPGAAVGKVVFSAQEAEDWAKKGENVILVRRETSPEDVGGMAVAQGILTATGGKTSHAAVVARGWGKCCIVGAEKFNIDYKSKTMTVAGKTVKEGEWV
ncbi:MAG: pyruvate, phosphate dikinase, partial [Alphaproteobacteria bacterium]|nr:pyruvate, phosphate dikinase [Alphaproteobacteria bacterium]